MRYFKAGGRGIKGMWSLFNLEDPQNWIKRGSRASGETKLAPKLIVTAEVGPLKPAMAGPCISKAEVFHLTSRYRTL